MGARLLPAAALASLGLPACTERPQGLDHVNGEKKLDQPVWSKDGAAHPEYVAEGYTRGDEAAWQAQIRERNQTQNEYKR